MSDPGALAGRWPLPDLDDVRDALLAAWGAPERGYHDLRHLTEVLDRLDELGCDDVAVRLAAWFHDAVYDAAPGDEERSARWAERALPAGLAGEVARLVRLTADHRPAAGDVRGQQLCDADLAILAAPAARYREYTRAVRAEYARVPDAEFARGRVRVLAALLDQRPLFKTAAARRRWEEAARDNVTAELAALRGGS